MRFAFLVPAPDFEEPWQWAFEAEAEALQAAGLTVDPIPWTEAGDLSGYDLVLPLVTWGYHLRYAQWLAFLDRLERERLPVANPVPLLRWSSDKAYLAELGDRGIATIPTLAVEQFCDEDLEEARRRFATEWLVIKPPVSAGATGTYRLGPRDGPPANSRGQPMIVQPLLEAVSEQGEFSLMLFDGEFSHAVVKKPKPGDFRVQPHLGGITAPSPAPPGGEELALAALAAAPAAASYARVDMIPDDNGELRIVELELVEPALFLDLSHSGSQAFTRAVIRAAERARARARAD